MTANTVATDEVITLNGAHVEVQAFVVSCADEAGHDGLYNSRQVPEHDPPKRRPSLWTPKPIMGTHDSSMASDTFPAKCATYARAAVQCGYSVKS